MVVEFRLELCLGCPDALELLDLLPLRLDRASEQSLSFDDLPIRNAGGADDFLGLGEYLGFELALGLVESGLGSLDLGPVAAESGAEPAMLLLQGRVFVFPIAHHTRVANFR